MKVQNSGVIPTGAVFQAHGGIWRAASLLLPSHNFLLAVANEHGRVSRRYTHGSLVPLVKTRAYGMTPSDDGRYQFNSV